MVATIGGTDLPVVSSLSAKNISLFRLVETAIEPMPSRAHQEGRYASSRTWSAGCDGCRRCRKTSGAARGRRSRTVLTPRGRRQARGRFPRATKSTKPGLRGDYEGNRNTIAQGMPECFGQPVVTMLVCFHLSRTRLRVWLETRHSLRPPIFQGRCWTELGQIVPREYGGVSGPCVGPVNSLAYWTN